MRLVRVAINAVALLLAALLVPQIEVAWSDDAAEVVIGLVAVAVVFGVVNSALRPIARIVSLPLNILTLGMFSVILDALLLLAMAFVIDVLAGRLLVIGGFPPDLGLPALLAALTGAFILSIVSTALNLFIPDG